NTTNLADCNPLLDRRRERQPQSRRCHLPNNQIVKDQSQRRVGCAHLTLHLLSRKQERNFHTAHRCLAAISRLRQRQNPNLVRASHPAGDSHPLNRGSSSSRLTAAST